MFDPADHPRAPAGSAAGGQFAAAGSGEAKKTPAKTRGKATRQPAGKKAPSATGTLGFDGSRGTGYGQKGGDVRVRRLQEALNRLGLTDASGKKLVLDGKFGPRTTAAVKAAQKRLGLPANGKVTPELFKRLTSAKTLQAKKTMPASKTTKPAAKPAAKTGPARTAPRAAAKPADKPVRRSEYAPTTFARTFALDSIEISRAHSDGRTVEAYAAVFDTPAEVRDGHGHYTEVISRTAFNKTLAERAGRVGVFYNHGYNLHGQPDMLGSVPIGTPVEIRADGRGLYTVTRYNRSPLAESVLEAIKAGDIRGQSFRGRIYQSSPGRVPPRRPGEPLPTITRTELGLTEYGPTPMPVYEGASIMAVRAEQIVAQIAGLTDEERTELVRMLSTTPSGSETTATPDVGAGTEEPRTHSGRHAMRWIALRSALRTRGVLTP